MDKNVRAQTFMAWSKEVSKDSKFLYKVYRELDKVGMFPPGMDKFSVESHPVFIKMASSGLFEGPTVMAVIKKIVGAYERTLIKQWDAENTD